MISFIYDYVPTHLMSIILIEALIIWVEAKVIIKMSSYTCFNESENVLPMKTALSISAIANITSIVMGFLLLVGYYT